MRVALLGPSADLTRCRRVADMLIAAGHELAYDWITPLERRQAAGLTDADLTEEVSDAVAMACLAGVVTSETVLWLASPSVGAAFEAGVAACFVAHRSVPSGCGVVSVETYRHPLYTSAACGFLVVQTDAEAVKAIGGGW